MDQIRVASVPATHPYVDHLEPIFDSARFVRLCDPVIPSAPPGGWLPSPVLDPSWLSLHAADFDVVHVHFGFEHRTPEELDAFVMTLRRLGKPLVFTVHDLWNPHLVDQSPHSHALDVLVNAAAAVITLTEGAAGEVRRRWRRRATVLRHPHVAALDRVGRARAARPGFVVGLHTKARANSDPDAVAAALVDAVAALPGASVHPGTGPSRLSDDELWDYLSSLDALVLPYRFGTHSGFVEACHDVGTTVIASRVGFLAEQHPVLSFDFEMSGSLSSAVRNAYTDRPMWIADRDERIAQRQSLAAAHANLYATAMAGAGR